MSTELGYDTYVIRSYRHAETIINDWWRANKPPFSYSIEIRGTFYMRARLAQEGRRVVVGGWQEVIDEGAFRVPLTDNAKYAETDDILLFFPINSEVRLTMGRSS